MARDGAIMLRVLGDMLHELALLFLWEAPSPVSAFAHVYSILKRPLSSVYLQIGRLLVEHIVKHGLERRERLLLADRHRLQHGLTRLLTERFVLRLGEPPFTLYSIQTPCE
jgi:hypothetical protein